LINLVAFFYITMFTVFLPHVTTKLLLDSVTMRRGDVLADRLTRLGLAADLCGHSRADLPRLVVADLLRHIHALLPGHVLAIVDIDGVALLLDPGDTDSLGHIFTLCRGLNLAALITIMVFLANILWNTGALLLVGSATVLQSDVQTLLLRNLPTLLLPDGAADRCGVGGADRLRHHGAAVLVFCGAGGSRGCRGVTLLVHRVMAHLFMVRETLGSLDFVTFFRRDLITGWGWWSRSWSSSPGSQKSKLRRY